jgi:hypothetical protein
MSDRQIFGKLCPQCKQFVEFGKIYIPDNTPPSQLHAKLQEIGWEYDSVFCENPECGSRTFGDRDEMILKARPPKA